MSIFHNYRKQIDKEVLLKAIEFLEAPHEASWDLSDVPGYVLEPLDFFKPDFSYPEHHEIIKRKGILPEEMSMENIRTMFTFFNRGERFCTGFTADIINNGDLLAVYKRLAEFAR